MGAPDALQSIAARELWHPKKESKKLILSALPPGGPTSCGGRPRSPRPLAVGREDRYRAPRAHRAYCGEVAKRIAFGSHAVASLSESCADGSRVLLRSCFNGWRHELSKFEAMERDLSAGYQEARMMQMPRTSAHSASEHQAMSQASITGAEWGLAQVRRLFWWTYQESSAGEEAEACPAELLPSTLARHNLALAPRNGGIDLGHEFFLPREEGRDLASLPAIHRERAADWRLHVRDGRQNIDESCSSLQEGTRVLFDCGQKAGVITHAYPDRDLYALSVRGLGVLDEAAELRGFRADELQGLDTLSVASSFLC